MTKVIWAKKKISEKELSGLEAVVKKNIKRVCFKSNHIEVWF